MSRFRNTLIAVSQLANAVAGGAPDETLSSRAFRRSITGSLRWRLATHLINLAFFWQKDHCRLSYKQYNARRGPGLWELDSLKEPDA